MNPEWFGDSYDIVKRFFISVLQSNGFVVCIEPMFTGTWGASSEAFFKFMRAEHIRNVKTTCAPTAVLFDPDTGVSKRCTEKHCTVQQLLRCADTHDLVFSFDQSFSRNLAPLSQMQSKLAEVEDSRGFGFYYNSHARFLFLSRSEETLNEVQSFVLDAGLPAARLVHAQKA